MQSKNFYTKVWKVFSREYYNMENKIFGFQFEPMCVKQTCSNYGVGSDHDEAETQYDRLSTLECYSCERCEKMSTSLECVCYHKIPTVKAFHLKFKARLSGKTAVLEFFSVEFNCVGNHFIEEPSSEIS